MGEAKDRRAAQVQAAMDQTARAISVIHRTALGVAGLLGDQEAKDVPRLCIAAGLRTVELMLEQYRGIKAGEAHNREEWAAQIAQDPTGLTMEQREGMYESMLAERRLQIVQALQDAEAALAEGHEGILRLGAAMAGPKVTIQ